MVLVAFILSGFIGGFLIGMFAKARWRRLGLAAWIFLPLLIYTAVFIPSGEPDLIKQFGVWLVGALMLVVPLLLFSAVSSLGYVLAPKAPWRLKDWRLPL